MFNGHLRPSLLTDRQAQLKILSSLVDGKKDIVSWCWKWQYTLFTNIGCQWQITIIISPICYEKMFKNYVWMKHDKDPLSDDNIFVSHRLTYAKHWSIPLVKSSKCNGHAISLRVSDSAVGRGGGRGGYLETVSTSCMYCVQRSFLLINYHLAAARMCMCVCMRVCVTLTAWNTQPYNNMLWIINSSYYKSSVTFWYTPILQCTKGLYNIC